MKINFKFLLLTFLLIFLFPLTILAQNIDASNSDLTVPQYIRNLYVLGLVLIGIVAFARLVYAGYQYMLAGANANLISSAKSAFWDVAAGITVLVCGLLLLRTINPDILNFRWSLLSIDTEFIRTTAIERCIEKCGQGGTVNSPPKCWNEQTWDCTITTIVGCTKFVGKKMTDLPDETPCSLSPYEIGPKDGVCQAGRCVSPTLITGCPYSGDILSSSRCHPTTEGVGCKGEYTMDFNGHVKGEKYNGTCRKDTANCGEAIMCIP